MRIAVLGCLLLLLARPARADDEVRAATGYRNGRPMKIQLVVVDTWAEVELGTARAYRLAVSRVARRVRHARRFGFRRTVRKEPWHWELIGRPRRGQR